jgi:hypothetical protein
LATLGESFEWFNAQDNGRAKQRLEAGGSRVEGDVKTSGRNVRQPATFRFQKWTILGGCRFSVFPPYILRREKGVARRRKSKGARNLASFASRFFGPTAKMKKSADSAQRRKLPETKNSRWRQLAFSGQAVSWLRGVAVGLEDHHLE